MRYAVAILLLVLSLSSLGLCLILKSQAIQLGIPEYGHDKHRLLRVVMPMPTANMTTVELGDVAETTMGRIYGVGAIGLALLAGGGVMLSISRESVDYRFSLIELFACVLIVAIAAGLISAGVRPMALPIATASLGFALRGRNAIGPCLAWGLTCACLFLVYDTIWLTP